MELKVIDKTKKTIVYIENIIDNFPKNEIVLKNNLKYNLYELLESIYYSSYLYSNDRINKLYYCLVKIKMIDLYINITFNKKIISYKKFINICGYLNEIVKMIYGMINYEKKR